jgi:hypothetical protein
MCELVCGKVSSHMSNLESAYRYEKCLPLL